MKPAGSFTTLAAALGADGLVETLDYHVVPGKVLAADVVKLSSAKTAEGYEVKITSRKAR